MARLLRGSFISPGARRLSRSASLESRSPADVLAVSLVFHQDDIRSLAAGHPFPACSHERGGLRRTRPRLGIRMDGPPQTNITLMALNPSTQGQAVTFTAKLTSPTVTPTGPVAFQAGTTVLGTVQLSG